MEWLFDAIIFSFLIASLAVMFILAKDGERWVSIFVSDVIVTLLAVAWIVIFYGSFIEPKLLVINQQSLDLSNEPTRSLHVAVISDLHAGRYKGADYMQRIVDTIIQAHPDIVLLLGDYVSYDAVQAEQLKPFESITAVYPTYAVLGNHDYQLGGSKDPANNDNAQAIADTLQKYGMHVLRNDGAQVADGMWLAGLDEIWTHHADLSAALKHRPANNRTLLLTHNPDFVKQLSPDNQVDLLLAGHTHGGQIRLPFIGPVPPIPDELGRAYDKGFFDYQGQRLFITSGTGESGPRARLLNPPEIVSLFIRY